MSEAEAQRRIHDCPIYKDAGRIGGRHTQQIQTPPLLVILSRRKTRKGIHWRGAAGFSQ